MKLRKATAAAAAALALALTATACGGDSDSDTGGLRRRQDHHRHQVRPAGPRPEDARRQVLRLRRRRRHVRRQGARLRAEADIEFKETKSADRENALSRGDVKFIAATYSINDERKEKVDFAGPYLLAHQDLLVRADDDITKADGPQRQEAVLGRPAPPRRRTSRRTSRPKAHLQEYGGYSECLDRPAERRRRRADHRRLDPRGLRRAGAVQGQVQARRPQAEQRELRHRREEGRHRDLRQDQRRAGEDGRATAPGRRPSRTTSARPTTRTSPRRRSATSSS